MGQQFIDPTKVRFSQHSIKNMFRDGSTIDDLASHLQQGSIQPEQVPAIRLVEKAGQLFTLDNRRYKRIQASDRARLPPLLWGTCEGTRMYLPQHFAETRVEELHRVITEYPLGVLVLNGPNGLDANHLPFALHPNTGERGHLLAHVARANPLWQEAKDGDEALVIFRAANAYISPNWYPSKHEFHRQVPTWNYQAVHVHGKIRIHDDERFVRGVVARLTRVNEARTGSDRPWKMTDSLKEYIDQMLTAIVGIEIEITKMIGKWKLSQNREERDRLNAAEELRKRGEQVTSTAMLNAVVPEN